MYSNLELLLKAWQFDKQFYAENKFISYQDLHYLKENQLIEQFKSNHKFLDKVPVPFWGNIRNPQILILTDYPQVELFEDHKGYEVKQSLIKQMQGEAFSYIESIDIKNTRYYRWNELIYTNHFINRYKSVYEMVPNCDLAPLIGVFMYSGYFIDESVNQNTFDDILPTQQRMKNQIEYLMQTMNPQIIVDGDLNRWLQMVPDLIDYNILTLTDIKTLDTKDLFLHNEKRQNDLHLKIETLKMLLSPYLNDLEKIRQAEENNEFELLFKKYPDMVFDYDKTEAYQRLNVRKLAQKLIQLFYPIAHDVIKDYMEFPLSSLFDEHGYNQEFMDKKEAFYQLLNIFFEPDIHRVELAIVTNLILELYHKVVDIDMVKELKFEDLSKNSQNQIVPSLRKAFDEVTYDTQSEWLMLWIMKGSDEYHFEDFVVTINEVNDELINEFNQKKVRLFLEGAILYKIDKGYNIIKYIDAYDEFFKHYYEGDWE